jgi:hypothetical protein
VRLGEGVRESLEGLAPEDGFEGGEDCPAVLRCLQVTEDCLEVLVGELAHAAPGVIGADTRSVRRPWGAAEV